MAFNRFSEHPLKIFNDDTVVRVHQNTLRVLDRVGIKVDSQEALKLFADYGVRCDFTNQRVFPDENAVNRALKTVSRDYAVFGRQPGSPKALQINMQNSFTISGAAAIKLCDGGKFTEANADDLVDMTVLHDKLDHIDVIINVVEPVTMQSGDLYPLMAATMFSYTAKPLLLQAAGRRDLQKLIQMASLLAGGNAELQKRPLFMTGSNAELPLHITSENAEILIDAARANVPCSLGCYIMAGSSGPFDVLASLVQRTAVVLAAMILTQAARPGSSYGFSCHNGCCDLVTGDVVTMSPAAMQLIAGSVQMGRFYNVTTMGLSATEAKRPDAQAAAERIFSLTTCLTAGASLVHGATAEMSGMELADFAQCVIDNEIAGYLFDFIKRPDLSQIDQSADMLDEIENNPEYKGLGFLAHPTTLKQCRSPRYCPDMFSCGMLSRWLAGDRRDLLQKAQDRADQLLREKTSYVPDDLKNELFSIARR
jgi:trimethylamine---corrinoid protein Co-methyltransferase